MQVKQNLQLEENTTSVRSFIIIFRINSYFRFKILSIRILSHCVFSRRSNSKFHRNMTIYSKLFSLIYFLLLQGSNTGDDMSLSYFLLFLWKRSIGQKGNIYLRSLLVELNSFCHSLLCLVPIVREHAPLQQIVTSQSICHLRDKLKTKSQQLLSILHYIRQQKVQYQFSQIT